MLVLHALPAPVEAKADALPAETPRQLKVLLRDLPLKQAVALAAELTGQPKNLLYQRALALKDAGEDDA